MSGKELYPFLVNNCFYTPKTYTVHFEDYSHGEHTDIVINLHGFKHIRQCHTHDFFEINYMYSGGCTNTVAGCDIAMKEGDAVIMAPGTIHSVSESDDFLMYNILIKPAYFLSAFSTTENNTGFAEFISSQDGTAPHSYICYEGASLNGLIDLMLSEQYRKLEDKSIMLGVMATQFILSLNRSATLATLSDTTVTSTVVSEILEYIYTNYKTVSLSSLAKEFDYSKEHLSRLIYKGTGVHFSDIVIGVKMNHVLDYMENDNLAINYICDLCGFESVENFHRLFKKKFGVSPNKFRQLYFSREELT